MKVRMLVLIVCISLTALPALAHGGEEHVIGTVSQIGAESVTIQTTDKGAVTVVIAPETKFSKSKVAAGFSDLQVDDRVVIHAKEVTAGKLVADTVEFSAPAARKSKSNP